MKITALIPAYNEAARLGDTLAAVAKIELLDQIVVIDDGSTDATVAVAAQYPVDLIRLPRNQGKGQALNAGWRTHAADIYLLLDADLQASAYLAHQLLPPVIAGDVDMTIANFIGSQTSGGQMGFGIGKRLARWGIRQLTGHVINSPLSGQRAVRSQVLQSCGGFAPGFGVEVALTVQALRHGYRVAEVDLPMTHRATGRTLAGFCHRGRQVWSIIKVLYHSWRNS